VAIKSPKIAGLSEIMEWQEFVISVCGAIIAAALFVSLFTLIQNWPL
jgi:hypothetical protein